jgi:type VI secretion system protein ImpH
MASEIGIEAAAVNGAADPEPPPAIEAAHSAADAAAEPQSARAVADKLERVAALLRADPHSFGFFQAIRLLERLFPERDPVGSSDPAREVVRLRVNPALGFPASEIQGLDLGADQPTMMINFMGLVGPQGVLPHQYSLLVADRLRARDAALADFLDLFHHRLLSLFYQAWRRYRFTIAREDGARDPLAAHLRDLIGMGLDTTHERQPFPDEALIHRAGLLAAQARGGVGLEQLLQEFFDVPAEVQQFVGGWYALQPGDRCAIGDEDSAGSQLGGGAVAGDEIWDQQARVRIRLGPLTRAQYDSFLPESPGFASLTALLRYYSHDQFEFEVQLVLRSDDVPAVHLGVAPDDAQRLGWTTWIRSAPRTRDADETILTLNRGAAS